MENIGALFFVWLVFSLLVGMVGSGTKLGFLGVFLISFILSPIVGIIVALVGEKK